MKKSSIFLSFFISLFCADSFSQDTIFRVTSDTIYRVDRDTILGWIGEMDADKIYFQTKSRGSLVNTSVNRDEVEAYSFGPQPVEDTTLFDQFLFLVGPSFPIGDFSSHRIHNNYAGYAEMDVATTFLKYIHQFNPYFGLGGSFYYAQNKLNSAPLREAFEQNWGGLWKDYGSKYKIYGAFASVNGFIPIDRFRLMGSVSIGAVRIETPVIFLSTITNTNQFYNGSEKSYSFAYGAGLGLGYSFSRHFEFIINAEYVSAQIESTQWNMEWTQGAVLQRLFGGTQTYSVINLTGGLAFKF